MAQQGPAVAITTHNISSGGINDRVAETITLYQCHACMMTLYAYAWLQELTVTATSILTGALTHVKTNHKN